MLRTRPRALVSMIGYLLQISRKLYPHSKADIFLYVFVWLFSSGDFLPDCCRNLRYELYKLSEKNSYMFYIFQK